MNKRLFTPKEWLYYSIGVFCLVVCVIPQKIGNWATDKLNKSYYKQT